MHYRGKVEIFPKVSLFVLLSLLHNWTSSYAISLLTIFFTIKYFFKRHMLLPGMGYKQNMINPLISGSFTFSARFLSMYEMRQEMGIQNRRLMTTTVPTMLSFKNLRIELRLKSSMKSQMRSTTSCIVRSHRPC
jgi:hypothetical protein